MSVEIQLNNNYKHFIESAILSDNTALGTIAISGAGFGANVKPIGNIYNLTGGVVDHLWLDYSSYSPYSGYTECCMKAFNNDNTKTIEKTYFILGYNEDAPEATVRDFCLAQDPTRMIDENNLSTEIPGINYSISLSSTSFAEDGSCVLQFFLCIKNISQSMISINEIGMCKYMVNPDNQVMLGRCVLPDALEIEAGESKALSIKIKIID